MPLRPLITIGLLLFVVVCAFLPARFQPFAKPMHRAVNTVVQPVSHLFSIVASSVRDETRTPPDIAERQQLYEELQLRYAAIRRLEDENQQLRRDLAALQQLSREFDRRTYQFRQAEVTGRSVESTASTITINAGTASGIAEGHAVVSGASLLGQVIDAGARVSQVRLITAPRSRVQAVVVPRMWAGPGSPRQAAQLCQFEVVGPRRLEAVVPEAYAIGLGDLARLKDDGWPVAAQGMVLGEVIAIEPIAEPVLRKRIVIETIVSVRYLRHVTVIVPRYGSAASGGGATP